MCVQTHDELAVFFRDVSISRVPLSGLVSIKSEGDEGIEGREGLDQ